MHAPDQIMKTRKRTSPVKQRARRPAQRPAGERRAGAARASAPTLVLSAECTVAEADSLKSALLRLLEEARPVTLEVGALQRIDTAALQLLAAFVRDRRTTGRRIAWRGCAPALDSAAALLGLSGMLELPAEHGP